MQPQSTPTLMLFAVLCGAACGVAGAWFRKGSQWAESHQSHDKHIFVADAIGWSGDWIGGDCCSAGDGQRARCGAAWFQYVRAGGSAAAGASQSASSAAASPESVGGRRQRSGSASTAVNAGFQLSQSNIAMLLGVLALTFIAKALVTLMTIRSGASGGVLQPGIAFRIHAGCNAGAHLDTVVPG